MKIKLAKDLRNFVYQNFFDLESNKSFDPHKILHFHIDGCP